MKTKDLTVAYVIIAMSAVFAPASFAEGTEEPPVECLCEPPEEPIKGNNGWGNGTDAAPDGSGGTNNGSFTGATSVTKSVNGPATEKFEGR